MRTGAEQVDAEGLVELRVGDGMLGHDLVEVVGPELAQDGAADGAHPLLRREAPGLEPGLHFLSGDELAIIAELGGRIVDGLLGTILVDGIKMRLTGQALAGLGLEARPSDRWPVRAALHRPNERPRHRRRRRGGQTGCSWKPGRGGRR